MNDAACGGTPRETGVSRLFCVARTVDKSERIVSSVPVCEYACVAAEAFLQPPDPEQSEGEGKHQARNRPCGDRLSLSSECRERDESEQAWVVPVTDPVTAIARKVEVNLLFSHALRVDMSPRSECYAECIREFGWSRSRNTYMQAVGALVELQFRIAA